MEKFFQNGIETVVNEYMPASDDRAPIGGARTFKWVECDTCGTPIERFSDLANKVFTCFDCKRKRQVQRSRELRAQKKHAKEK